MGLTGQWIINQFYATLARQKCQYETEYSIACSQREDTVGSYGFKSPSIGYNLNAYQGSNHAHHAPSESDVYGFAERREAEGSEDFDAFVDQSYSENHRLSTTLPSSNALSSPAKEVRFDVFSEPSSPYGSHPHQVRYKQQKHSRLSNHVSARYEDALIYSVIRLYDGPKTLSALISFLPLSS